MRHLISIICALAAILAFCLPAAAQVNPLDTPMVLVNQIGYDVGEAKTFLVQMPGKDLSEGRYAIRDKADGRVVFQGEAQPLGAMASWNGGWKQVRYWKGDFTKLDKPGRYVIEVESDTPIVSPAFAIGHAAAFRDVAPFAGLAFLKLDRWENGGWQSDGVPGENNVLFCVAACALGLARAYEADTAFWKQQNLSDAMLEEIRWGLKGLIYCQTPTGQFVGTNPDGRNDTYAGLGIAALARLARAPYLTQDERSDCLRRAKLSWEYYKDKDKLVGNFQAQPDGPHYAPLGHGVMVLANSELYETEKDRRYIEAGARQATLTSQCWNKWWPYGGGWAMDAWQGGIAPGCLADFAIKHPKDVPQGVKNTLRRWTEYVSVLSANPFGMPAWDRNHFFNPIINPPWQVAENGRYITNAWALMLGSKWSGKANLRTLGLNSLNWVLGVNPAGICMIRDKGERPQTQWWGMVRPGSISNGMISIASTQGVDPSVRPIIASDNPTKDDSPGLVGNQFGNTYVTSEPWTPYNGWMLIALAEMVGGK